MAGSGPPELPPDTRSLEMKYVFPLTLAIALLFMCGCAMYERQQPATSPEARPKPLAVPIGKNWQIVEEAPKLTTDGSLPFQKEQSVQPEGARTASPKDKLELETPH
jgi:hypothetical protein